MAALGEYLMLHRQASSWSALASSAREVPKSNTHALKTDRYDSSKHSQSIVTVIRWLLAGEPLATPHATAA